MKQAAKQIISILKSINVDAALVAITAHRYAIVVPAVNRDLRGSVATLGSIAAHNDIEWREV
jgi:hypothetical protein